MGVVPTGRGIADPQRGARMETLSRFTYETVATLAVGDAYMRPARRFSRGCGFCAFVGAAPPRGRPTIREQPAFKRHSPSEEAGRSRTPPTEWLHNRWDGNAAKDNHGGVPTGPDGVIRL